MSMGELPPPGDRLEALRERLRAFVAERDWDQFHNPKNLAMALVAEAGELVEHFQWLTPEQSERLDPAARADVAARPTLAALIRFLPSSAPKIDPPAETIA